MAELAPWETPTETEKAPWDMPGPETPITPSREAAVGTITSELPPLERKKPYYSESPRKEGGQMIPEDTRDYKRRQAQYYGFNEVPEKYQYNYNRVAEAAGFLPDQRPEYLKRIVKKAFGDDAKLKIHEGYGEPVIEFKSGEVVPFLEIGTGEQTVRGWRAPGTVIAAEAFGGTIGGVTSGPFGAVVGVGAGAFAGEYDRLLKGQEAGFHDMSKTEMLGHAAIDAAIAMGLEVGTLGIGFIVRRMIQSSIGKEIVGEMSEEQIDAVISEAARYERETGRKLTTGQAIQQAELGGKTEGLSRLARETRTVEESLVEAGESPEIRRRLIEQDKAAEQATKQAVTDAGADPIDLTRSTEVGQEIGDVARDVVERKRAGIVLDFEELRAAEKTIIETQVAVPTIEATAEEIREYLVAAKEDTFDQLSQRYKRLWAEVPEDTIVDMSGLRDVAKVWKARLDKDILPALTEEQKIIVQQAQKAGLEGGEVTTKASRLPPVKVGKGEMARPVTTQTRPVKDVGADMDSTTRAISELKAEMREITAGTRLKKHQKKMLVEFTDSLEDALQTTLQDLDPSLQSRLKQINDQYGEASTNIYGSFLNRVMRKNSAGGYRIADTKVMENLARNPEALATLNDMISSPEYAGFGGTEIFKDGMWGLYRSKVVNPDSPMTHASFMNQYGPAVRNVFSPEEMKKWQNLRTASDNLRQLDVGEKNLVADLEKSFDYKLANYDAEEVFKKTKGKLAAIRKVKKLLKNEPDKWGNYKKLYSRDFLNRMMDKDDLGLEVFSAKKLAGALKKNEGELQEIFGQGFVNDLNWVSKMMDVTKMPKRLASEMTALMREQGVATTPILFWRATVARPLSRKGVATTAGLKYARSNARKALANLMENPEKLKEIHRMYVKGASLRKWRSVMRTIGFAELAHIMNEEK